MVLCAASRYEQKYFLNTEFEDLPEQIKDELHAACVLYTEEIGGVILLEFDENGNLNIATQSNEEDILYDEIGARLKIKQLQKNKKELFEQLELYYSLFFGEDGEEKRAAMLERIKEEEPTDEELERILAEDLGMDEEDPELEDYSEYDEEKDAMAEIEAFLSSLVIDEDD